MPLSLIKGGGILINFVLIQPFLRAIKTNIMETLTRSKFETFTTISGEKIEVRPNHRERTFTIKTSGGKYRTVQLDKEEFNSCLYNTGNDWREFLKSSDYYRI